MRILALYDSRVIDEITVRVQIKTDLIIEVMAVPRILVSYRFAVNTKLRW